MLAQTAIARDAALDLDVVSFSNHGYVPEQLMSIRSFLREAGTPASWTVVSDGTHTRRDAELLARVHPCVRVVDHASFRRAGLTGRLVEHASAHPGRAQERFAAEDLPLSWTRPWFYGQTLVPLAMHASGAAALDGGLYVLQFDDERTVRDIHRSREQRMRHYCRPVRYRFWLRAAPDVLAAPRASVHRRR